MPTPGWLDDARRLLEHVRASDALEVEVARGDFRLRARRSPSGRPPRREPAATSAPRGDELLVPAPLTGVFYRAASPGAAPYVSEGDAVQPDTVIGLIETMKIFNEVVAEHEGRVRAFKVDSGQLVHAGEPILSIEQPLGSAADADSKAAASQ
ncbi:MAG: acetyl-CoA carboxylase [Chloroflexota bacterium]